jgi:hypothetical protein
VKGKRCDARGASANTVSRALLAAARTQAEQTKAAPRVTLPLPSARTVKTVVWWTLGIVLAIAAMPFVGREHDRPCLEQGEIAFLIGRDLTERMKRQMRGLLHRTKRNKANLVGLAYFLKRPANARITRQSPAAIG